jgi:hypothetical protein
MLCIIAKHFAHEMLIFCNDYNEDAIAQSSSKLLHKVSRRIYEMIENELSKKMIDKIGAS